MRLCIVVKEVEDTREVRGIFSSWEDTMYFIQRNPLNNNEAFILYSYDNNASLDGSATCLKYIYKNKPNFGNTLISCDDVTNDTSIKDIEEQYNMLSTKICTL